MFWLLKSARVLGDEITPRDNVAVRFIQLLFEPTAVVGVKWLGRLAGPYVVIIKSVQCRGHPSLVKLAVKRRHLAIGPAAASKRLQVYM